MNITLKTEWLDAANELPDPGRFLLALCRYIRTRELPELPALEMAIFNVIRADFDKAEGNRQRVRKSRNVASNVTSNITCNGTSNITCNGTSNITCNGTCNKEENPPAPPKEETKKSRTKVLPKESGLSFAELIPSQLKTIEFEIAWDQWTRYRRETRKSLSVSTAAKQLEKLGRYPPAVAIAAIDESITNGWQGLFPDRVTIKLNPIKQRDHSGI